MTEDLRDYLKKAFQNVLNFDADDPLESIDPLSYRSPEGDNCLHIAASMGEIRAVEYLIGAGIDVNQRGDMGYVALHYARKAGFSEIVQLLLDNGADPGLVNEFGEKAMP
jgi:ankyrin repeat protein